MTDAPSYLDGPNGRIAYRKRKGHAQGAGVVWFGGYKSDMTGSKAAFVEEWAKHTGCAFLRFDYTGHGESDGEFEAGCIGDWAADALAAFDALTEGPQILIGSSMGGWIATLVAKARPDRIAGAVFIAPAPDFTERLLWPALSEDQRETLMREGRLEMPSEYDDEPYVYTKKLVEDGRNHLVLTEPLKIAAPMRILQGMQDDTVPWSYAIDFADSIQSNDVEITLVKNGDHRLSSPHDLERLACVLDKMQSGF